MLCRKCGMKIPDTAKYCPECGAVVEHEARKVVYETTWNNEKHQRKSRRAVIAALIAIVLLIVAIVGLLFALRNMTEESDGHNYATVSNSPKPSASQTKETPSSNAATPTPSTERMKIVKPSQSAKADLSIEQGLIYDDNDITVEIVGAEDNGSTCNLDFVITNNSDRTYSVDLLSYSINGIMENKWESFNYSAVPAGKKSSNTLTIDKSDYEKAGYENLEYVGVLFFFYENDDFLNSFTSGVILIHTNFYTEYHYLAEKETDLIYEDDTIYVIKAPREHNYSFDFYVINKSPDYFSMYLQDMSVDGWAFDGNSQVFDEICFPGCASYCSVAVDDDFLKQTGGDANSAEFLLKIRPLRDYGSEYATDIIHIDY